MFNGGMVNAPEKPLTLPAMARQLRVPTTWLKAEADAGRLPCVRAGRAYLFDAATVIAAVAERARRGEVSAND